MEGYIGEVRLFAGNFAPRSWAYCDGSSMSISEYSALYAIIGDTFGGNGVTSFNLPDLRSRVAVGAGTGPGLTPIALGQAAGSETTTMSVNQMPAHNHFASAVVSMPAYNSPDTQGTPTNNYLAGLAGAYSAEVPDSHLAPIAAPVALSNTGAGIPFPVMQPITALNYIICLEGIFPSRNN